MLTFSAPVTDLISQRFSCRHYQKEPIPVEKREQLQAFMDALPLGPFGSRPRFRLVAATETDGKSLRGLGTYGFIKNPPAFILGAMKPSEYDLEDYGYLMEAIILNATGLGLGTCWLGGTFKQSSFAREMSLTADESMPAATSVGEIANPQRMRKGLVSRRAGAHQRLAWESLFFKSNFDTPILRKEAAGYTSTLEMVQIAPSASNKQPWRILKQGRCWRFYLQRTPGYYQDPIKRFIGLCDLQRLDMGIAMCHFELAVRELGLEGRWIFEEDAAAHPDPLTEYLVSWEAQDG